MPAPDPLAQRYLEERIAQYQSWYDNKSVQCKSRYLIMRAVTIMAASLVPVLANLPEPAAYPVMRPLVTALSLLVIILIALDSVFNYREQWKNYRSTEQFLGHEKFLFLTGVGIYKGMNQEDALQLLAERVEDAIAAENGATLNIMTLAENGGSPSQRGLKTNGRSSVS
jgi:hypothetical protein